MAQPGLLRFDPILVAKPWGGERLSALGKNPSVGLSPGVRVGESWEIADLPPEGLTAAKSGRTRVTSGPHQGMTLRRLIADYGSALLGSASATQDGDFPLLFKLLDTAEHLSIQVHPDQELADQKPDWVPKTESWYVLEAEPEAFIYIGLRPGVLPETVAAYAGTCALATLMNQVFVKPGDFYHLQAGTVHALGAGVTVAEVQTPSDTTFRLYDWTAEYGRSPRDLHLPWALDALSYDPTPFPPRRPTDQEGARLLVETPYYWIREHRTTDRQIPIREVTELRILLVAKGKAEIVAPTHPPLELIPGSTILVPACLGKTTRIRAREKTTTLLEIGLA
ncbi:MAG: class I mannose-6-phosphate isomerase [bacterium]|nr:class I mannose-6-phosphate isomerase [bacterium]